MPDGLYEQDFLLWSEAQAGLLRRLATGERVNAAVDWLNLIEEVEDLGRSHLHAVESLIVQALIHLLKLQAWPDSLAQAHWRAETSTFLSGARRRFTPSMRPKIDLPALYRDALTTARLESDPSGQPLPLADLCPIDLEQLLAPDITSLWAVRLGRGGE